MVKCNKDIFKNIKEKYFMVEKFMLLSNGVKIPSIGFGTYKSGDDEETAKIIKML